MFVSYVTFSLLQIYMHNRQDITETNLKPALLEGKDGSALPVITRRQKQTREA